MADYVPMFNIPRHWWKGRVPSAWQREACRHDPQVRLVMDYQQARLYMIRRDESRGFSVDIAGTTLPGWGIFASLSPARQSLDEVLKILDGGDVWKLGRTKEEGIKERGRRIIRAADAPRIAAEKALRDAAHDVFARPMYNAMNGKVIA